MEKKGTLFGLMVPDDYFGMKVNLLIKVFCFDFNDNFSTIEERELIAVNRVFDNAPNSKNWKFNISPEEGQEMLT